MNKIITRSVMSVAILALAMWGCEDEKAEKAAPKGVTVSVGWTNTVFEDFSFATDTSFFDLLVLWSITGTDTLHIMSFAGSVITPGTAVALNDSNLWVTGIVGNGTYAVHNFGTNTSGSFIFSSLGATSAEGSVADNSKLDGIKASDGSTANATISVPFIATKVADIVALGKARTRAMEFKARAID